MDSKTMLNKNQILKLDLGQFYKMITREECEQIYNLMADNFSESIKEEHYLNGFLEFFKTTAKEYHDTYIISIQMFIDIFIDELNKRRKAE